MSQEQKVGIIRAFFRYLRFWNWKQARFILNRADEQFTGSVEGISAAFDIHQDKLVGQYRSMRDAIAQVESVLEDKRSRLEELNLEEDDLISKREGALLLAEESQAKGDQTAYDRHAQAFERFQVRIDKIETRQERLDTEITETGATMDRYMLQLQEMQGEIEKLPVQKAEAVSDFVSAKQIVELNDRLQGLESSIDRGPISAVLKANRDLTAKARISEKMAGSDVKVQDKAYERAGRESTARSKLDQMLAARKVERDGQQEEPKEQEKQDDRPPI